LLSKHFNTRRKIYQDLGGEVQNFDINILKWQFNYATLTNLKNTPTFVIVHIERA
jgi:hypothetical protein